jgi:hypothetical protein
MNYDQKQLNRDKFLHRLQIYWNNPSFPRLWTRIGEIYEVDFGENVGTEFSGRHLAICLSDTEPSNSRCLVVPITTKYVAYNIPEEDIIRTKALLNGKEIVAGVVSKEARWISKVRIFPRSLILEDPEDAFLQRKKAEIEVSKAQLKRWKEL